MVELDCAMISYVTFRDIGFDETIYTYTDHGYTSTATGEGIDDNGVVFSGGTNSQESGGTTDNTSTYQTNFNSFSATNSGEVIAFNDAGGSDHVRGTQTEFFSGSGSGFGLTITGEDGS